MDSALENPLGPGWLPSLPLLRVLFGPHPRLLGVAVGSVLWLQLPAWRVSEGPRIGSCCQRLGRNQAQRVGGRVLEPQTFMGSSSSTSCSEVLGGTRTRCREDLSPASQEAWKAGAAVQGCGALTLGGSEGWKGCWPEGWPYLSSARMPTERDASAVTASTSASAPGTLATQESGQVARRCMQPQYLPGARSPVRKDWRKQAPPPCYTTHPRPTFRCTSQAEGPYHRWGVSSLSPASSISAHLPCSSHKVSGADSALL